MPPKNSKKTKEVKVEDIVEIVDHESENESEPEPVKVEPPKKSKKAVASKQTSEVVQEPVAQQVVQASKTKQAEKKSAPIVSDWNTMADDISVEEIEEESEQEEVEQPRNTFRSGDRERPKSAFKGRPTKSSRFANSEANFSYQEYTDLDAKVSELSNSDLVKILIVRSYSDNQHDFCRTMKTVLRAMNLECPMPGSRPVVDTQYTPSSQSQPYTQQRPPTRNSSQPYGERKQTSSGPSMFGNRNQRKTNDPHDF
jgi:hypothetical protein